MLRERAVVISLDPYGGGERRRDAEQRERAKQPPSLVNLDQRRG